MDGEPRSGPENLPGISNSVKPSGVGIPGNHGKGDKTRVAVPSLVPSLGTVAQGFGQLGFRLGGALKFP